MIRKELRILLLSGGALAGAWQAGVLARRIESGQDWDVVAGTSIGALAAACVFQGKKDTREIHEYKDRYLDIWRSLKSSHDLISKRWFGNLNLLFNRSLYDNSSLKALLDKTVNIEKLKNCDRAVRVGTIELEIGLYRTFNQQDNGFKEAVLASSSIPIIFPLVQIGDKHYMDGGLRESTPVRSVLDIIESTNHTINITVIQCSTGNMAVARNTDNTLSKLERTIDIMSNEISNGDMEPIIRGTCGNNHRTVNVEIYRPLTEPVKNVLDATGQELKLAVDKGYAEGDKPVKEFFV